MSLSVQRVATLTKAAVNNALANISHAISKLQTSKAALTQSCVIPITFGNPGFDPSNTFGFAEFANGVSESIRGACRIPTNLGASNGTLTIRYYGDTANTNDWSMIYNYQAKAIGEETDDIVFVASMQGVSLPFTSTDHEEVKTKTFSVTGLEADDVFQVVLGRQGTADAYTGLVGILAVDLTVTLTLGAT